MDGYDGFKEVGFDWREMKGGEEEGDEEVGDYGEGEEQRSGAQSLPFGPSEVDDGWVVN